MTTDSMTMESDATLFLGEAWFDPIEAGIREQIRGFIEGMIEEELTAALGRRRYERGPVETRSASAEAAASMPSKETPAPPTRAGYRHGHRERRLCGSFGAVEIAVPRARIGGADGRGCEWKSKVLPRYARMTRQVEALIAGTYLAGTNTRRVRRALAAGDLDVDIEVIPGISSIQILAARHKIGLNEIGQPIHITTGRQLAAHGPPDAGVSVVVMLVCGGLGLKLARSRRDI